MWVDPSAECVDDKFCDGNEDPSNSLITKAKDLDKVNTEILSGE